MARYHQAAMYTQSTGVVAPGFSITGYHVHPKAKSNDMMMMAGQHARQPHQIVIPGAAHNHQISAM